MSINFNDIVKSYDGIEIFNNISGKIYDGDKIGLIGINGVGKTTLIKILLGEEEYDSGSIEYLPYNQKFGYLKQSNNFPDTASVNEIIKNFSTHINSGCNNNSYSRRLKKSLMDLGFKERDLNKKFSKLSGGEKTRLSLCIALINNPDILILDEPTNNLDVKAIKWLENFIKKIKKTVLIISHDRYFLDKTVTKVFEMKSHKLTEYKGSYSNYKLQKSIERCTLEKEHDKQTKEIKMLEKNIEDRLKWFFTADSVERHRKEFNQNKNMKNTSKKHISTFRSKTKRLDKLKENRVVLPKDDISGVYELFNKRICDYEKLPKYLVRVNRLKKAFGNRVIFDNAAFNIKKGDKIALIGENGSGKTTLLKMLMALESRDSGTISINPSLKIGYFSQELEHLNTNNTIVEELVDCGVSKREARNILGSFLFKGEDVFKYIYKLSMGEKCRVAFAKLLCSGYNFLILDEPTNHMDIVSRENIEETLRNYNATLLFVSHDRYFVKGISTRVFEVNNHKINCYEGDYEYYLQKKNEEKKKEQIGEDYKNIEAHIIKLECDMAYVSSMLDKKKCSEEEKQEKLDKFFSIAYELEEYRKLI